MKKRMLLVWFIFIGLMSDCFASSLNLENVSVQEALSVIAKRLSKSIIISPEVSGNVTLHLQGVSLVKTLDLLLSSHQLIAIPLGQAEYILPVSSWMQTKQDAFKRNEHLEETAPLVTRVWQIHYAKAEDIGHLLQDARTSLLTKRGHVRVDARTNILCIQEIESHISEIDRLIERLDVPIQQVLIEAKLASLDNDSERELGIHFSSEGSSTEDGSYSLAVLKLGLGKTLEVALKALETEGRGELISSPRLLTGNQQPASIESGEEIPYQEVSRSGATSVAFKKAVLSLKVIPQIMPHHKLLLQLQVNQDRASNRMILGVPAISTRQMTTNVLVSDGQTVVLGGIYESNDEETEQRIPFLGKLPFLGFLFRERQGAIHKRELLIFVTPKIIPELWDSIR